MVLLSSHTRTIVYLQDFLEKKRGETETVDYGIAKNMVSQGIADIFEEKKSKPNTKAPEKEGFLPIRTYEAFEKIKLDKSFIVQELIFPHTVNMIFSPPGQFKSIIAGYLAECVTNGKNFFSFKTKKSPVLLLDKENGIKTMKIRLMGIRKGLRIHRKKFPLYILVGEGDLDSDLWREKLKDTISEYKIRLIIFDTLHRFSNYKEDKADEVNNLYRNIFQPLTKELDCSILFLHHSTKEGIYRGSSDFMGMVDTAYSVRRAGKTNKFSLINEKNRWGEVKEIEGQIDFLDENEIKITQLSESDLKIDKITKISLLKEVTRKIMEMFPIVGIKNRRNTIIDDFEMLKNPENPESGYSIKTIQRSLNWLVLNDFLEKSNRGEYVRLK